MDFFCRGPEQPKKYFRMNSKRRYNDGDNMGRSKRPNRNASSDSPYSDSDRRLRTLIIKVGDKQTASVLQSNLEALASVIESDFSNHKELLLTTFKACVTELPMKTSVYATLLGLVNAKQFDIAKEFVNNQLDDFEEALRHFNWTSIKLNLRFFGELVSSKVILPTAFISILHDVLDVLDEATATQIRTDSFLYVVLASFPWVGSMLKENAPEDLEEILEKISKYMKKRSSLYSSLTCAFQDLEEKWRIDELQLLWKRILDLKSKDWKQSIVVKPNEIFSSVLGTSLQHDLRALKLPTGNNSSDYMNLSMPFFVYQLNESLDSGISLPPLDSVESYILLSTIKDVITLYEINRKECSRILLALEYAFKVDSIVLSSLEEDSGEWTLQHALIQTIFENMFSLPANYSKLPYYAALVSELCKAAPKHIPSALGRAIKRIFSVSHLLDLECVDCFSSWFSHHLSNFDYIWKWDQWESYLEDPYSIHYFLMQDILQKAINLSYYERVKDTLSEKFFNLIPATSPKPNFSYSSKDECDEKVWNAATTIMENVKNKKISGELMIDILESIQSDLVEDGPDSKTKVYSIFFETLLMIGHKTLSHVFNMIERYLSTLKVWNEEQDIQILTIDIICKFWSSSYQIQSILLDKLITYQIINPLSVTIWITTRASLVQFCRCQTRDLIKMALGKSVKRISQIKDRIEKENENKESLQSTLGKLQQDDRKAFIEVFRTLVNLIQNPPDHERVGSGSDANKEDIKSKWRQYGLQYIQILLRSFGPHVKDFKVTLEMNVFLKSPEFIKDVWNQIAHFYDYHM